MSKTRHQKTPLPKSKQPASNQREPLPLENKPSLFPLPPLWVQSLFIAVLSIAIYFNSIENQYALDDGIVIEKNEFVQEGISGIDSIMGKDAFHSFYTQMGAINELPNGRYRPLSIVTFAIEQEMFGITTEYKTLKEKQNPISKEEQARLDEKAKLEPGLAKTRHLVNVLMYALGGIIVLLFLQQHLLQHRPDIGFIAALIFVVHPIHTEVVSNVKSRDEIMSLIFILLTLMFVLRHSNSRSKLDLLAGMGFMLLALLSKEYGVALLALIPILLYVKRSYSLGKAITATMPFVGVVVIYIIMRFSAIMPGGGGAPEVLNDPYLYASAVEKFATRLYMPVNYIKLLIFPHPLSSDYSYSHFPFHSLGSPMLWVSVIVHVFLVVAAFRLTARRHILGFALFFYLLNLALVANIFISLGATMGERLIYHSSLGFAILVGYGVVEGAWKIPAAVPVKRLAAGGVVAVVAVLFCIKTYNRNFDWKNDFTLFTTDVKTVPNSILANGNAGAQLINSAAWPENKDDKKKQEELIRLGITYLQKAVQLHKPPPGFPTIIDGKRVSAEYINGYLNLGLAHYKLGEFEQAADNWVVAAIHFPSNPYLREYKNLLMQQAFAMGNAKKFDEAISLMDKVSRIAPQDPEVWYNVGGAYFSVQNYPKAKEAWSKCISLNPNHQNGRVGLSEVLFFEGNYFIQNGQPDKARELWNESLKHNPNNAGAKNGLASLPR